MSFKTRTYEFEVFAFGDTYSISKDLERITTLENNLSALMDVLGNDGIIYGLEISSIDNKIEISPGLAIVKTPTGYFGLRLDSPLVMQFDSVNENTAIFLTPNGIITFDNAIAPVRTYPENLSIPENKSGFQWKVESEYSFSEFNLYFDIATNNIIDEDFYRLVSENVVEFDNKLPATTTLSAVIKPDSSVFIALVTTTATQVTSIDTSLRSGIGSVGGRVPEHNHFGLLNPSKIALTSITKKIAGVSGGNGSTVFKLADFQGNGYNFYMSGEISGQLSGKKYKYVQEVTLDDKEHFVYFSGLDSPYKIFNIDYEKKEILLNQNTFSNSVSNSIIANCIIHVYSDGFEISKSGWEIKKNALGFQIITDVNLNSNISVALEIPVSQQEVVSRIKSDFLQADAENITNGQIKKEHIPMLSHDGFVDLIPSRLSDMVSLAGSGMLKYRPVETLGTIHCVSPAIGGHVYVSCEHGIIPVELLNGRITGGKPLMNLAYISDRTTTPFKMVVHSGSVFAISDQYILVKRPLANWSLFANITENNETQQNPIGAFKSTLIYDCDVDHRNNLYLSTNMGILFMNSAGTWFRLSDFPARSLAIVENHLSQSGKIIYGDRTGVSYLKNLPAPIFLTGTSKFKFSNSSDFIKFLVGDTIELIQSQAKVTATITSKDDLSKEITVNIQMASAYNYVLNIPTSWTAFPCQNRGIISFDKNGTSLPGATRTREWFTILFTSSALSGDTNYLATPLTTLPVEAFSFPCLLSGGQFIVDTANEVHVYNTTLKTWNKIINPDVSKISYAFGLGGDWHIGKNTGLGQSNAIANGQKNSWVPCFQPMLGPIKNQGSFIHGSGIASCRAGNLDSDDSHFNKLDMKLIVQGNLDRAVVGDWLFVTSSGGGANVGKRFLIVGKEKSLKYWTLELQPGDGLSRNINFAWGERFIVEKQQGIFCTQDFTSSSFQSQTLSFAIPVNKKISISNNFSRFKMPTRGKIEEIELFYNGRKIDSLNGTIKEITRNVIVLTNPIFLGLNLSGEAIFVNGVEYRIIRNKSDNVVLNAIPIAEVGNKIVVPVVKTEMDEFVFPSPIAWQKRSIAAKIPDYYIENG